MSMVLMLGLFVGGCATAPEGDPEALMAFNEANDPYEPLNRGVFEVNLFLDKVILRPVSWVYKETIPRVIRDMVRNLLNHLRTPVIFANDLLQGEFNRAGTTLMRFTMNSTFGFLGIADIATDFGFARHDEDFGQTLAVAGFDEGAYLMLPILGPSNLRDGFGRAVDILFDPLTFFSGTTYIGLGKNAMTAVEARSRHYDEINDLERSSLDYYATLRSLYRQSRNDDIRNGVPAALDLPQMDFEDEGEPAPNRN